MKLITAKYCPETGVSFATVEHRGRKFRAFAKCHPDDFTEASKFAGCGYAETRAIIKALKRDRREKMQDFYALMSIFHILKLK